jgi:hypothetical protein
MQRAGVERQNAEARLRVCTDCGLSKAVAEFTPIKACKQGWYGRCRACRAKRARERYQSDPIERETQKGACAAQSAATPTRRVGVMLPIQ